MECHFHEGESDVLAARLQKNNRNKNWRCIRKGTNHEWNNTGNLLYNVCSPESGIEGICTSIDPHEAPNAYVIYYTYEQIFTYALCSI